jgi:hypothetical protein
VGRSLKIKDWPFAFGLAVWNQFRSTAWIGKGFESLMTVLSQAYDCLMTGLLNGASLLFATKLLKYPGGGTKSGDREIGHLAIPSHGMNRVNPLES